MPIYLQSAEEVEARLEEERTQAELDAVAEAAEREYLLSMQQAKLDSSSKITVARGRQEAIVESIFHITRMPAYVVFMLICAPILVLTKREAPQVITDFFEM